MPSSLPSSGTQIATCQFFGTSNGTTVCKSNPMDGVGQPMAAGNVLFDTEVKAATGTNFKHTASKTADEFVLSQSSNHTSCDKTTVTSSMSGQGICDTPPADVMELVEGAQYLSLGDGHWNVSKSNQEKGCTCVGSKSGKAGMRCKEPLKELKCDEDTSYQEQDQDAMTVLSNDNCLQEIGAFEKGNISQPKRSNTEGTQFDRPCTSDVQVPGQCCKGDTRGNDLDCLKEGSHDARSACGSICKIESGSALPGRKSEITEDSISPIFDMTIGANTPRITNQSPHFSVRDNCGACGNNRKCGIEESFQYDMEMGDSSNHSESARALMLSPKAVIQAVGQLRFWKARLNLIRQQRIFSDQVFELHKLIEVQRLMAGASSTLIDDIYFCVGNINKEYNAETLVSHSLVDKEKERGEALPKQVSASKEAIKGVAEASNCLVNKEEGNGEALGMRVSASKEATRDPTNVGEANTTVSNRQVHLEKFTDGSGGSGFGASAWRYPSLGVANWITSLPGKIGVCNCPPFAEAFRPGLAVGSPFVLGNEGAAVTHPPIFPYGFPVCLQRQQPTPASAHQQHPAPYHSVFDPSGPSALNKKYWAAEVPAVSVTSVRSQPNVSQHQIKSAYPSSLNTQLHMHKKEMQPGRKRPIAFGSQAEDLQYTAMGSNFNTSTVRPSSDICEHSEQGSTQPLTTPHCGHVIEKMSRVSKEVRGWERQKERSQQAPRREV